MTNLKESLFVCLPKDMNMFIVPIKNYIIQQMTNDRPMHRINYHRHVSIHFNLPMVEDVILYYKKHHFFSVSIKLHKSIEPATFQTINLMISFKNATVRNDTEN